MACNSYAGGYYLHCYDYYLLYLIAYLIILELATMNPLGWHPPYVVGNTDTTYLGEQHWQQCSFIRFLYCIATIELWMKLW